MRRHSVLSAAATAHHIRASVLMTAAIDPDIFSIGDGQKRAPDSHKLVSQFRAGQSVLAKVQTYLLDLEGLVEQLHEAGHMPMKSEVKKAMWREHDSLMSKIRNHLELSVPYKREQAEGESR